MTKNDNNNHSPTTSSPLWAAFLAPIHANLLHASPYLQETGEKVIGYIIVIGSLLLGLGLWLYGDKLEREQRNNKKNKK